MEGLHLKVRHESGEHPTFLKRSDLFLICAAACKFVCVVGETEGLVRSQVNPPHISSRDPTLLKTTPLLGFKVMCTILLCCLEIYELYARF